MTDLQQQEITVSSQKSEKPECPSTTPPEPAHISYNPEIVGKRFGWVEIISPEKRWSKNWNHCLVQVRCSGCGTIKWINLNNLQRGKSRGCQACSQPRQIPIWLHKRLTAAKMRCENPKDPEYQNYGARGIRFDFPSVTAAGLYLMEMYKTLDRSLQLDRIDNNGNYAAGNLRMVPRSVNQANRRITVLSEYDPRYWPYAETVVRRKLAAGLTREEIIGDAEIAVFERRKNWRRIAERLASMIYETPETLIVTPYRGSSYTTADTAEE